MLFSFCYFVKIYTLIFVSNELFDYTMLFMFDCISNVLLNFLNMLCINLFILFMLDYISFCKSKNLPTDCFSYQVPTVFQPKKCRLKTTQYFIEKKQSLDHHI